MLKRAWLAWVLAFALVLSLFSGAMAATQTSEGVEVTLESAKSSYQKGEDVEMTLSVKNLSNVPLSNFVARLSALDGYTIDGSGIYSMTLVGVGDTVSYSQIYKSGSGAPPSTGDNSHIGLWMVLMLVSLAGATMLCMSNRRARKVLAIVLCVMSLAGVMQPSAAMAEDGVTTMEDFPPKMAVFTRSMSRTVSIDVTEPVRVDNVTVNVTAHVEFSIPSGDNLVDDIIDRGDLEMLELSGKISVLFDDKGHPLFVDGTFTNQKIHSAADAAEVLNNASSLFGDEFYAEEDQITVLQLSDAETGSENFYRYTPDMNGVKVLGSQIVLGADERGNAVMLSNTYDDRIEDVNTRASITSDKAVEAALNAWVEERAEAMKETYADPTPEQLRAALKASVETSAELIIYAASDEKPVALVYSVNIREKTDGTAPIPMLVDETLYIYANGSASGTIHSRQDNMQFDLFWSSKTVNNAVGLDNKKFTITVQEKDNQYRLKDTGRDIHTSRAVYTLVGNNMVDSPDWTGTLVSTSDLTNNPSRDTQIGISGHANMAKVYDYYKNKLGRNSYNGWSAELKVVTNAIFQNEDGIWYTNNACWSPSDKMFMFGSTYMAALDVAAHEFTHAVTEYVNGLIYSDEAGALNEAYSDIMGSLVEDHVRESARWIIGEDGPRGAIRSMENPSSFNQPEHYNRYLHTTDDNGGVHDNSGIINFAAYKMMTSDDTKGIVSYDTWAKIFYDSMHRLSNDATFLQMRGAVVCSARKYGLSDLQLQAVRKAFDDVGVCESDSIRIVLTWGDQPRDLDAHLVGPGAKWYSSRFHVYYANKVYYESGSYDDVDSNFMVDLDYDDVTSIGPEIITIRKLSNDKYKQGDYYFYVHDYTNGYSSTSSALAASGATVNIYVGDSNEPFETYTVSPGRTGTFWDVCKISINSAGTVTVTQLNRYGNSTTLR